MNVLLQGLERDGVVTRAAQAPVGKALPTELTAVGRERLAEASAAVRSVEDRMLGGLDAAERAQAGRLLRSMVASLREPSPTP